MAGFLPNEAKASVLEAIVGRTSISSASRYLGLAVGLPVDIDDVTLTTITEVTTAGYARRSTPAFNAASTVAPIQITNGSAFSFAAVTADMDLPATYAFLTDAPSGTSGKIWYVWELPAPVQAKAGEGPNVPVNALVLE